MKKLLYIFLIFALPLQGATYYVATTGNNSNAGSFASPWATWQYGFSQLTSGDDLYIRGGTYTVASGTYGFSGYCGVYKANVSGSASDTIKVYAYPGEVPILDCRNITNAGYNHYGIVTSNCFYWKFKGLRVCNVKEATGYYGRAWVLNASSHVNYIQCAVYECADGFVTNGFCDYIRWTNCDSYDHVDTRDAGDLANGWTTGGYGSGGNFHYFFEGCRAWHNSDDGYDFLNADGVSHGGYITMNNCWAFDNGHSGGNGVGFKLGGWIDGYPDGGNQRVITNCLAWGNSNNGFDENVGGGAKQNCILYHNVAYRNNQGYLTDPINFRWCGGFIFSYTNDGTYPAAHILRNNIAFENQYWDANTPVSKCTVSNNSWPSGGTASTTASAADFISVNPTGTDGARQANGNLPVTDFLKLAVGSDLIGAGVAVAGYTVDANGVNWATPPSIGAYEVTSTNTVLTVCGQTQTSTYTAAKATATDFTYCNNSLTLSAAGHYGLLAGAESTDAYDNNLDGAIITGNKFVFAGTDPDPHGVMVGFNTDQIFKYNYVNGATYGLVYKSGADAVANMDNTTGVCAYNIFYNNIMAIRVKGFDGAQIYNNVFYNARAGSNAQIYITKNTSSGFASVGTKIKNNIFYITSGCQAIWVEAGCQSGFECDYNVYYCNGSNPVFAYSGSVYTWTQWRALGYDAHSIVMNPGFVDLTDFVPAERLDYGINLGVNLQSGLSTDASWVVGTAPEVTNQNGSWQVGVRVYEATSITPTPVGGNGFIKQGNSFVKDGSNFVKK